MRRALHHLEAALGALCLATGLVIVFGAFFGRELFGFSFSWSDEVARYLLVWITFFGAAALVRENGHIRVEFILDLFAPSPRRAAEYLVTALSLVFTAVLFAVSAKYVFDSWTIGLRTAESELSMPKWIILSVIPIGFFLMSVHLLVRLRRMIADGAAMRPKGTVD